jgi:hypothetical protein
MTTRPTYGEITSTTAVAFPVSFHDNVVVVCEPPGECLEMITSHTNPAQPDDLPFIEHHRLG